MCGVGVVITRAAWKMSLPAVPLWKHTDYWQYTLRTLSSNLWLYLGKVILAVCAIESRKLAIYHLHSIGPNTGVSLLQICDFIMSQISKFISHKFVTFFSQICSFTLSQISKFISSKFVTFFLSEKQNYVYMALICRRRIMLLQWNFYTT